MRNRSYDKISYRLIQANITKQKWRAGIFNHRIKPLQERKCDNPICRKSFFVKPHTKNRFCGRSCAAIVNNTGRTVSEKTRLLKSQIMKLKPIQNKRVIKMSRIIVYCHNPICKKELLLVPYMARKRKYCSRACVMAVISHQTTSPKASKGKPGIRSDVDPEICFYSTWEANFARVLNLLGIRWIYAPKIFDLGQHTYRPDFYIPDWSCYIEIKNFMNDYSKQRDQKFRELYPNEKLEIIGRDIYMCILQQYKPLITNWE